MAFQLFGNHCWGMLVCYEKFPKSVLQLHGFLFIEGMLTVSRVENM